MPIDVLESDRSLNYVLLHGDDKLASGWSPAWINESQARELLSFLEYELEDETGYDLIPALRRRLG